MLRTLPENFKTNWSAHLNKLVHAYNCTRNESTGFSPFYLFFGRHPRLPIDIALNINLPSVSSGKHKEYAAQFQKAMEQAYKTASQQACNKQSQGKQQFDKKAHYSDLKINDRVLVRNLLEKGGPGKIRAHWEDKVHIVVGQADKNLPVYEVAPETGQGRTRTLHRNLLLPCSFLSLISDNTTNTEPKCGRVSTKQSNNKTSRKIRGKHAGSTGEVNEEDSSDEECTLCGVNGQAVQPVPLASLKLSMAVYGQKLDGRPSR